MPIGAVGNVNPVSVAIYGQQAGPYNDFMHNVNSFLTSPALVAQYDQNLADFLSYRQQSSSWGISFKWFSWSSSASSSPGPAWRVDFCNHAGDCSEVLITAEGAVSFLRSHDSWNYGYPRPAVPTSGGFQSGVVGDIHLGRIDQSYSGPITSHGNGWTVAYITCTYVNGVLVGIAVYPE